MLSVSQTQSGFEVRKWVDRLVAMIVLESRTSGPAFCSSSGNVIRSQDMENGFHSQLELVQEQRPDLINQNLDVRENYSSIFRSLRRGSTSRTSELAVPDNVVNLHNRWRKVEAGYGVRSFSNMRAYYTEMRLTRGIRLEYTRVL